MESSPVLKRAGRLIEALTARVGQLQGVIQPKSFRFPDLSSSLDSCNEALSNLEAFLLPAYAASPTGVSYSCSDRSSLAKLTYHMISSPLASLLQHVMASMCHGGGHSGDGNSRAGGPNFTRFSIPISTIVRRVLLLVNFTLENFDSQTRRDYVTLLHRSEFFPLCCAILSGCTDDFQLLSISGPTALSRPEDRQEILLCAALLGCTIGEYVHASYGDVRWASDIADDEGSSKTKGLSAATCPSKRAVWAQLQSSSCRAILCKATELLTTAAVVGTFYQRQSELYQKLLTPTLGVDSLVSRVGAVMARVVNNKACC